MPEPAPLPDAETGLPRPPKAYVRDVPRRVRRRAERLASYPPAPQGQGPVLEWDQPPVTDSYKAGVLMAVLVAVFLCVRDGGVGWMATWWLWIFVFLPVPVYWLYGRAKGISAGARWFASGSAYVDLYRLTSIRLENSGGGLSRSLYLVDSAGSEVGVSLYRAQRNQALWDLVYNGIVHSMRHNRASANEQAVDQLRLY